MHPEIQNRDALQLRLGNEPHGALQGKERERNIQVRAMIAHDKHRAGPIDFCKLRLVFNRQIDTQDLHAEPGKVLHLFFNPRIQVFATEHIDKGNFYNIPEHKEKDSRHGVYSK